MTNFISRNSYYFAQVQYYLLPAIAFLLPFKYPVPAFTFLLIVLWFLEWNFKSAFIKKKSLVILLVLVAFFLSHFVSAFFSSPKDEAWFNVELKLSFLVFPLFFYSKSIDGFLMRKILKAFVMGNVLASFICLICAFLQYIINHQYTFYYSQLSIIMHPGYFSMYLNFALIIVIHRLLLGNTSNRNKLIYLLLVVLFSLMILLLSSKIGILTFLLFGGILLIYHVIRRKHWLLLFVVFAGISLFLVVTTKYFPTTVQRFRNLKEVMNAANIDKTSSESNAVRLLIWGTSVDLIKEKPLLGHSPGEVNEVLFKQYETKGFTGALQKHLNAHNQFLQTGIGLGIWGILLLCIPLIAVLIKSIREKNVILLLFGLIIFANFSVESMLQTQAGVLFYAFFISLFLFNENFNFNTSEK